MEECKSKINAIISSFTGRDGEPGDDNERYILYALWVMMMSGFEATVKEYVEDYLTEIKQKDINDIHICLLIRNFHGNKDEELTLNKIISFYKKNSSDITFANFTKDRVPKYKSVAIRKLFNNLGIFFTDEEYSEVRVLDSMASTRDSIAHGDHNITITCSQLTDSIEKLENLLTILKRKLAI